MNFKEMGVDWKQQRAAERERESYLLGGGGEGGEERESWLMTIPKPLLGYAEFPSPENRGRKEGNVKVCWGVCCCFRTKIKSLSFQTKWWCAEQLTWPNFERVKLEISTITKHIKKSQIRWMSRRNKTRYIHRSINHRREVKSCWILQI